MINLKILLTIVLISTSNLMFLKQEGENLDNASSSLGSNNLLANTKDSSREDSTKDFNSDAFAEGYKRGYQAGVRDSEQPNDGSQISLMNEFWYPQLLGTQASRLLKQQAKATANDGSQTFSMNENQDPQYSTPASLLLKQQAKATANDGSQTSSMNVWYPQFIGTQASRLLKQQAKATANDGSLTSLEKENHRSHLIPKEFRHLYVQPKQLAKANAAQKGTLINEENNKCCKQMNSKCCNIAKNRQNNPKILAFSQSRTGSRK